jgi:hypothetical protein
VAYQESMEAREPGNDSNIFRSARLMTAVWNDTVSDRVDGLLSETASGPSCGFSEGESSRSGPVDVQPESRLRSRCRSSEGLFPRSIPNEDDLLGRPRHSFLNSNGVSEGGLEPPRPCGH